MARARATTSQGTDRRRALSTTCFAPRSPIIGRAGRRRPRRSTSGSCARVPAMRTRCTSSACSMPRRGRLEEALPLLTKAARRTPRNAGFLNDLANVFNGLGRFDEAEAHYRRAAAFDKSNADIRYNFGHALRAAGRPAEAVEWVREGARDPPRSRAGAVGARPSRCWRSAGPRTRWRALRQTIALNEGCGGRAFPTSATRCRRSARWRRPRPASAARSTSIRGWRRRTPTLATCCRTSTAWWRRKQPIARPSPSTREYAAPHANLGNALKRLGREDEAVASLGARA